MTESTRGAGSSGHGDRPERRRASGGAPQVAALPAHSPGGGGPPRGGDDGLVVIGVLGATHGVLGEWRFFPETDFPERLRSGRRIALCPPGAGPPVWTRLRRVRPAGSLLLLAAEGVATVEAARAFVGGRVAVAAADLPPLPEGHFYHHQVVGLTVVRPDGRPLGRLTSVLATGANDVYVVRRPSGAEVLVPATRGAVEAIDVTGGVLRLRDLPGLLDDGGAGGTGSGAEPPRPGEGVE